MHASSLRLPERPWWRCAYDFTARCRLVCQGRGKTCAAELQHSLLLFYILSSFPPFAGLWIRFLVVCLFIFPVAFSLLFCFTFFFLDSTQSRSHCFRMELCLFTGLPSTVMMTLCAWSSSMVKAHLPATCVFFFHFSLIYLHLPFLHSLISVLFSSDLVPFPLLTFSIGSFCSRFSI